MLPNLKSNVDLDSVPAFDRDILAHHTMQDVDLQQQVLAMFFSQLAKVRARLEQGPIAAGEAKAIAHTLRGAASAVGAKRIEVIAKTWEEDPTEWDQVRLDITRAEQDFLAEAA